VTDKWTFRRRVKASSLWRTLRLPHLSLIVVKPSGARSYHPPIGGPGSWRIIERKISGRYRIALAVPTWMEMGSG
jgi:hypothetical protein